MPGPLAGPGLLLQNPSGVYPASILPNGQIVPTTNEVALAPGQALQLARGRWRVEAGAYCVIQYLDPILNGWRGFSSARSSPIDVESDGFNYRVANLTGCAIAALVTNGGSNYVQGTTTAVPASGNSQWQPVVGGRLNTTVSITAAGTGYTIPPLVFFPPPPQPGVQASGIAVLSSGTVSSITMLNVGAGYQTAPVPQILPNPLDPAFLAGSITANATATTTLVGAGTVSAVICTNNGEAFTSAGVVPSLTIAGAGSSAAATIVPMWTLTSISITSGGAGYSTTGGISSVGGQPSAAPAYTNPALELTGYIPRPVQAAISAATGGTITTIGTIIDSGLFAGTPTLFVQGGAATTNATLSGIVGSVNASVILQQMA